MVCAKRWPPAAKVCVSGWGPGARWHQQAVQQCGQRPAALECQPLGYGTVSASAGATRSMPLCWMYIVHMAASSKCGLGRCPAAGGYARCGCCQNSATGSLDMLGALYSSPACLLLSAESECCCLPRAIVAPVLVGSTAALDSDVGVVDGQ
jgi:hypothetical protein